MSCSDPECTYSYCVETRNKDKVKELEEKLAVAERAAMQNGCDRNKAEFKLAIAIEALEKMRAWGVFDDSDVDRWRLCEATLEKIKG